MTSLGLCRISALPPLSLLYPPAYRTDIHLRLQLELSIKKVGLDLEGGGLVKNLGATYAGNSSQSQFTMLHFIYIVIHEPEL